MPGKMISIMAILLALVGCASDKNDSHTTPRRQLTTPEEKVYADKQFAVYDPAETVNKHVYVFNARLDEYVLIPIVNGYTYVTPEIMRDGVENFFSNIGEVGNFTNSFLQVNVPKTMTALGRFSINSTVGLLGTIDVASKLGLTQKQEDFGKTLGHWGVGMGPYIVLPFFGPSNLRDTVGKAVDYATLVAIIPNRVQESPEYDVAAYGLQPVNARYRNSFRYYQSGSPFEYELVRYIYTQGRILQIDKDK